MSSLKSKLMFIGIICRALLAVMVLSESAYAGECASLGCDDGSWDPMAKLDEIGTAKLEQSQFSPKWPEDGICLPVAWKATRIIPQRPIKEKRKLIQMLSQTPINSRR